MKIECILQRKGGTSVELDGAEYHFKPDGDGRHVCDVKNPKHIQRFLSISEGYQIFDNEGEPLPDLPPSTSDDDTGESTGPGEDGQSDGGGETLLDGPPVEGAETLTPDDEEEEGEEEDDDAGEQTGELDREVLAEQYKVKFGQRPHGKWTAERIQQELAE